MSAPLLIGGKIYLAAMDEGDAELYRRWLAEPEVRRFLDQHHPLSPRGELEFIRAAADSEQMAVFAVRLRADDRLLGNAGLTGIDPLDRFADFGVFIGDKTAWGKGIGAEAAGLMLDYAFNTLNLNRVQLIVAAEHARAVRCYEKAGFKVEGRLRQNRFREGGYRDDLIMAALGRERRPGGDRP